MTLDIPPSKTVHLNKADFATLSPEYIINKINKAQKKNEKIKFKGIGLESTVYYRKYISTNKNTESKGKDMSLPKKYLKIFRTPHETNERAKSFNRIKNQLSKGIQRRTRSFAVVLESNLDRAFNMMNRNLNRVTAYAKYNYNFL